MNTHYSNNINPGDCGEKQNKRQEKNQGTKFKPKKKLMRYSHH